MPWLFVAASPHRRVAPSAMRKYRPAPSTGYTPQQ